MIRRIKKIEKRLKKQKLNSDFIVKTSDYMSALPGQAQPNTMTAQLNTPPINPQLVAGNRGLTPSGLTASENAYLSNEEKAIKLRSKGMA